jgi:regulator of nucleoside diphosphate kinase
MEERAEGEVMMQNNIIITGPDMEKLRHLLDSLRASANQEQQHFVVLEEELDRARIMPSFEVPPDVVTMNSKVRLTDLQNGKKLTYTLVFPRDANFDQGKISILAPIGTAILGSRTGDVIEWKVPASIRRLRVEEILHQPEGGLAPPVPWLRRAGEKRRWTSAPDLPATHAGVERTGLSECGNLPSQTQATHAHWNVKGTEFLALHRTVRHNCGTLRRIL